MRVTIDVSAFDEDVRAEVRSLLVDVASEWVNHLQTEAPMGATGDLRRSIQIFQTRDDEIVLGTRNDYAKDVWKGTPPHIADFEALQVWARRKLNDESAAGPVWRKIAQEGTNPNDYVGRALDATLREFR